MVYVNSDGTVSDSQPFGLTKMLTWFWGILNFFYMFIVTLFNPGKSKYDSRYTTDYRPPGSGPPRPPNKFRGFGPSGSPGAPPAPGCGCGG